MEVANETPSHEAHVSEPVVDARMHPVDGISRFHNPAARLVRCSSPKNDAQKSHLCAVWASPMSFDKGLAQTLVDLGLTDCAPYVWDSEGCPANLQRLWDPLPPPGYSPFEKFTGTVRPDSTGPFEYMIDQLLRTFIDEYRDANGIIERYAIQGTVRNHPNNNSRFIMRKDIALTFGMSESDFACLESYVNDAYYLDFTRKFRHTYFDKVKPLHLAGHKLCSRYCRRYVHEFLPVCDCYVSPKLPDEFELVRRRRDYKYMQQMFCGSDSPLDYVSIYFGPQWVKMAPLPIRVNTGELGVFLSKLTPTGRTAVCSFFNRTNRLPSFVYAEWVLGYEDARGDLTRAQQFKPFTYDYPVFTDCSEEGQAYESAYLREATGPVKLSSLLERNEVHLNFPAREQTVVISTNNTRAQAPLSSWGMFENSKSVVHSGSQIYYEETRNGVTRRIPLTRWPMSREIENPAFQELVEKAFATPTDASASSNAANGGGRACPSTGSSAPSWMNPIYSATNGSSAFTSA